MSVLCDSRHLHPNIVHIIMSTHQNCLPLHIDVVRCQNQKILLSKQECFFSSCSNSGDLSVSGDIEAECCEGWRDETCVAVLTSWIQFRLWTVDTIRSRVQVWARGRLSVENYDIQRVIYQCCVQIDQQEVHSTATQLCHSQCTNTIQHTTIPYRTYSSQ